MEEFVKSTKDFNGFSVDIKTQSAVERQLSIIGEAISKFDKLFPEHQVERARKIVGFRNRLIHSYDKIDSSIIWAIIINHLPQLKTEITNKLKE
ncbi:MAG: DUF86 domain-containing protein [Bacteroidales bacterium]